MPGITYTTVVTALGALAVVLALVLLAQRAARWGGMVPRGTGRLAIVEAVALDQRRRLCLVHVEGRQLLLLTGGTQDIVVGWVEPPSQAAATGHGDAA